MKNALLEIAPPFFLLVFIGLLIVILNSCTPVVEEKSPGNRAALIEFINKEQCSGDLKLSQGQVFFSPSSPASKIEFAITGDNVTCESCVFDADRFRVKAADEVYSEYNFTLTGQRVTVVVGYEIAGRPHQCVKYAADL